VNAVSIRCSAQGESAEELEAWLTSRLESVEQRYPSITTHLARLSAVRKGTAPAVWLIDLESSAGPLEESPAPGELYHELRAFGLGLAPTILVPVTALDWSRGLFPATQPRRTGGLTPGADDAGELVGQSSFPASDPPAVWTWEPPGPFPSG
jgi:hypothetical protein